MICDSYLYMTCTYITITILYDIDSDVEELDVRLKGKRMVDVDGRIISRTPLTSID